MIAGGFLVPVYCGVAGGLIVLQLLLLRGWSRGR